MKNHSATLFDSQGNRISIGALLGRGGEGIVYDVTGKPDLVAKIYHKPDADRNRKISVMHRLKTERLLRYTAWPVDTLHETNGGSVVGLLMPKVSGYKDIHKLYGPKTRMAEFTNAGLPFLVHTAANIARAFAVVHEEGQVIGDVNHSNIVVSDQAMVMLIDCDSFQITANNERYKCTVGVPTHQPPEFQQQSLRDVNRTSNHDNFGLAVLVFQILFLGRHPFSGRFLGSGEMPIERAIEEFRFAYGPTAAANQMQQPPNTLPLEIYPPEIGKLFERAFSREGVSGKRPTAQEWINALENLARQLKTCDKNKAHSYWSAQHTCPFCEFEKRGIVFFNAIFTNSNSNTAFQLEEIWAKICSVQAPPELHLPTPAAFQVAPAKKVLDDWKEYRTKMWLRRLLLGGGSVLSLVVLFSGYFFWCLFVIAVLTVIANRTKKWNANAFRASVKQSYNKAVEQYQSLQTHVNTELGNRNFHTKKDELFVLYNRYKEIPQLRHQKMRELEANRRTRQFNDFLDKHFLANVSIKNIGPGRKAVLQSYGIETARDITRDAVLRVPGFGPSLTNNLLEWRRSVEARFVFDKSQGVSKWDVQALEKEMYDLKTDLEHKLIMGESSLRNVVHQITVRRQVIRLEAEKVASELAQTEANWKVVFGKKIRKI